MSTEHTSPSSAHLQAAGNGTGDNVGGFSFPDLDCPSRHRGAAPTGETCTIEDVGGYLQDHPGSRVPLTRRVLNAGHRPGDPVEVCALRVFLGFHRIVIIGA